tara:strand:- start:110 stop:952 length:843 start_codon:yes stop_codon:yes gene_type:complete
MATDPMNLSDDTLHDWYISVEGEVRGPFRVSKTGLHNYINDSSIVNTYVWREGFENWIRASYLGAGTIRHQISTTASAEGRLSRDKTATPPVLVKSLIYICSISAVLILVSIAIYYKYSPGHYSIKGVSKSEMMIIRSYFSDSYGDDLIESGNIRDYWLMHSTDSSIHIAKNDGKTYGSGVSFSLYKKPMKTSGGKYYEVKKFEHQYDCKLRFIRSFLLNVFYNRKIVDDYGGGRDGFNEEIYGFTGRYAISSIVIEGAGLEVEPKNVAIAFYDKVCNTY